MSDPYDDYSRSDLIRRLKRLDHNNINLTAENCALKNTRQGLTERITALEYEVKDWRTKYSDLYKYTFGQPKNLIDKIFGKTSWVYNFRHRIQK